MIARSKIPNLLGLAALLSAGMGLALPGTALAWKHIDPSPYAWNPEDLPLEFCVAPYGTAPDLACEESLGVENKDYCVQVMQEAHEAWEVGAPCANLGGGAYLGACEPIVCPPGNVYVDENGLCANIGFNLTDPRNSVGFEDPNEELETGVLGANLTFRIGTAFILNGITYVWADNSDIVFNDNVDFATHEDVSGGLCQGRTNLRAVATHEVGHLYGMGHSCDEFEACTDPDLRAAVMYWTSAPCEELVDLQKDDIAGINTLYGPSAGFACSHQVSDSLAIGVVPFEMKCVVESEGFLQEVSDAHWTFGDGNTADGINVTNTYVEAGNYTVEVDVVGQRDTCISDDNPDGEWDSSLRKVGFVRACDLPIVGFTYDHVDGLVYQMLNDSDVSVFGCIQDIQWQVYKGDGISGEPIAELSKKAWEPRITFPEEGTYTVIMNVGGPAGTSAAMITLEAKDHRGEGRGCSNAPAAGLGSAGMLALFGLLGIRRRD